MAGLVDISRATGLSIATVSRALRGLDSVNQETQEKVLIAAKNLNYEVDEAVSAKYSSKTIGVLCPYISRWFFTQVLAGIENSLREVGYDLLLYNLKSGMARENLLQEKFSKNKIDGLIDLTIELSESEIQYLINCNFPTAVLGHEMPGLPNVVIDDYEGAVIATQHLIDLGHSDIAFMSGEQVNSFNFNVIKSRRKGFIDTLSKNNIRFKSSREVISNFTVKTSIKVMDELLSRKENITAIFCESDEMAFGALQAIKLRGLKCPQDISVIGFDGHPMAELFDLTTIEQPVEVLGELTAWSLLDAMRKPDTAPKTLKLPTKLIVRGSTKKTN